MYWLIYSSIFLYSHEISDMRLTAALAVYSLLSNIHINSVHIRVALKYIETQLEG